MQKQLLLPTIQLEMGKDKLRKFAEVASLSNVHEPSLKEGLSAASPLRGNWNRDQFGNEAPITLELACGKGEYTVGLAQQHPNRNFVGVDIKGARIWRGAKTADSNTLTNARFLRSRIEFIASFFAPGEVEQIWIIFPDPQPQSNRIRKRLTHPLFLTRYAQLLKPTGTIRLKTDDFPLYEYTLELAKEIGHPIIHAVEDIYAPGNMNSLPQEIQDALNIKTYYETRWLKEGRTINFLEFSLKQGE